MTRTWQSSKFVQDIILQDGADQVDVANDIDWHETHVLLKAAFPLAATSNKATYEIPYGSIERAPRATTVGNRRSLKFPLCAGPIWAMGSTASAC